MFLQRRRCCPSNSRCDRQALAVFSEQGDCGFLEGVRANEGQVHLLKGVVLVVLAILSDDVNRLLEPLQVALPCDCSVPGSGTSALRLTLVTS